MRGGLGGSGVRFLWKSVCFLPPSTLHPPTSLRGPGLPLGPSGALFGGGRQFVRAELRNAPAAMCERQFARRHVRHDLVVRGASDPFVAGQATTHPLVLGRPAHPRRHRRVLGTGDFPG